MMDDALPLGFALLAGLLAALMSFAMRRVGAPGMGLLFAVLIGALLGPTVLGRTAPGLFDRAWIGSEQEIAALDRLDAEHGAWMHMADSRALELDEVTVELVAEKQRTWQAQRKELLNRHHQAPRLLVLALAFLIMGASCVRRRSRMPGSFLLGAWLVVACGGLVILVDRLTVTMISQASMTWIAAGVAVATCAGSIARPGRAALLSSAQFATVLALVALTVAATLGGASYTAPLVLLAAALLGLVFSTNDPAVKIRLESISRTALAPAVVAITLLDIDLFSAMRLAWLPIAAWLAMSDLRWLVAVVFLRCKDRSWIRTAIDALPLMGGGWLAVAIIGVGFWTEQLGEVGAVWLLFAAVLAELEGDWRRSAARILAEFQKTAGSSTPGTAK